ncbi:unnamed protein product [Ectocarpus sp. 8 AP-2014]
MQLASSVATRAARLVPRSVIPSTPKPAPKIPGPLPGAYNPSAALWRHDSGETSSIIQTVRDETELAQLLAATRPSSLVVVKFGEALCNASKTVEEKFKQTAAEFSECDKSDVQFASVDSGSNWLLCKKMGVRSVPHVQIFSGYNGKIADFSLAPPEYDTLDALLGQRRDSMLAWKQ